MPDNGVTLDAVVREAKFEESCPTPILSDLIAKGIIPRGRALSGGRIHGTRFSSGVVEGNEIYVLLDNGVSTGDMRKMIEYCRSNGYSLKIVVSGRKGKVEFYDPFKGSCYPLDFSSLEEFRRHHV